MKYTIVGCLALLAVAGLTFAFGNLSRSEGPAEATDETRIPSYTWAEMRAIAERADELDEVFGRMRRFSAGFAEVRDGLWARKVSPRDAAEHTLELARDFSPLYLRAARSSSPGLSDPEAVLVAILKHMRAEPQTIGCPPDRTDSALEEIVCELFASAEMAPSLERAINDAVSPESLPSH